ncbi:MAG: hypothetical protein J3K34DRAFT_526577 [Monoraphidium minutum]|nr:MAG: hypothetical protein J3K34DRAFT_526577 [Monoraphidium minutum]
MPGVSILEELHSVCAGGLGGVAVDTAAAAAVAATLKADDVRAAARTGFPVKFDSLEDEITFLAIYRLLDFGGEFDRLLRAAAGRGARETLQFGALGMHLGGKRLDRFFLSDFSAFSVTNYFSFEARVDHELQPGITISKPGPLQPLAEAIRGALNGAGAALERLGCRTLGQHILGLLDGRAAAGEPALAAALIADLAANIPGFDDVSECGGQRVPFYRKAQALAGDLFARFGGGGGGGGGEGGADPRFAWDDAERLAGDSGAAAAAAWRALGVVQPPDALAAAVDAGQPVSGDDEAALRAAAVAAADAVAAAAGGELTAAQVSAWAAGLLDDSGELAEKAKPHIKTGTVAY